MKSNSIQHTDALTFLKALPDESINCVITSPPYWGLRSYGSTPLVWDGDAEHDHIWGKHTQSPKGGRAGDTTDVGANRNDEANNRNQPIITEFCECGAWKGELGLEPSLPMFLNHLQQIFTEVHRALTPDGSCWVNLGDTYAGGNGNGYRQALSKNNRSMSDREHENVVLRDMTNRVDPVMAKSLCMVPERFAINMVDAGFILRNTIIWHKPSCMPSSATDRFTVDFEKLFFFTKSPRYYFKQQLEPSIWALRDKRSPLHNGTGTVGDKVKEGQYSVSASGSYREDGMRNMRTTWSISNKGVKDAHFAVFPEELVTTPIRATCPEDGIVVDPFMGSGTVAIIAHRLGRKWMGAEINPDYIQIAEQRLHPLLQQPSLFT